MGAALHRHVDDAFFVVVSPPRPAELTRIRIEGDDVDPRVMTLTSTHDSLFVERVDGNEVVFTAGGDIFAVG